MSALEICLNIEFWSKLGVKHDESMPNDKIQCYKCDQTYVSM